ncbi:recombinase family protein [Lentibacillus daqui]|uniref:recombinase family protein n=1 Tax=Lentibacillus daqui TaxID=2911514 RepID=UPI0022B18449|nr:recombinase family protein [Lentibacillus daqui]
MTDSKTFAYIRVSSKEQNESRQIHTMREKGVPERNIFVDKLSGSNTNRPQYQLLKTYVRKGDTVIFDSISRMSRNMDDTKNEYKWFVDNGISLQFVKEPMLDYDVNNIENDPVKKAIPDIILTLLASFAEKERLDTRQRQREGIDAAKRNGKHLGRPKKSYETLSNEDKQLFHEQYRRWKNGEQTAVQTMNNAGLKKSTFYKIVNEYESLLTAN